MQPRSSANTEGADRRQDPALLRTVIGVDFHPPSLEAARWTMRHLAPDAEHHLVHVRDFPTLPAALRALGGQREALRTAAAGEAERRLVELAAESPSGGGRTHLREGRPAVEVVRCAEEVNADLIVVGREGPRRGVAALLGSTAELTLADTSRPLLLARRCPAKGPGRILAAVDDAPVAHAVLRWTGMLARRFDASVSLLHVVDRTVLFGGLSGFPEPEILARMETEAVDAMRGWIDDVLAQAKSDEATVGIEVSPQVRLGDPSYEIIAEASRSGADLVVLGTKGGDVARTTLVGRVINKVVRSAPCPVLVVPEG